MLSTKSIFKKAVIVAIAAIFLITTSVFATNLNGDSSDTLRRGFYDIGHEDPEWKTFKTGDAMRAAIYLPEETFTDLSTEEVLIATMEYPLIGDIIAFSTYEFGIEKVSENCTALRILLTRPDAHDAVKAALAEGMEYVLKIEEHKDVPNLMLYILEIIDAYLAGEIETLR